MGSALLLSDPHFGTERPEVVRALMALCANERPDVLIWCGDITQRARRAQFEAAQRVCQQIGARHTVCIPGNHDIPLFNIVARMLDPYRGYRRAFGAPDDVRLSLPGLLVIGLNTTRPWRHKHGEVSGKQVRHTCQWLKRAHPAQLRMVVTHQPVWVANPRDRRDLLRGHEAALQAWSAAGVDVIVSGHIHLPSIHGLAAASHGNARALCYVQAGTAVSSRVRGGTHNTVHILRYGTEDSCPGGGHAVEQWEFDGVQGAFRRVQTHLL